MPTQDLDALKVHLTDYVHSITRHSKNGLYVCPLCGSGTGEHKTGAFSVTKDGLHWKCFVCGKGGDIFDLCGEYEHLEPSEAVKRIIELYGSGSTQGSAQGSSHTLGAGSPAAYEPAPRPAAQAAQPARSFADDIARFAAALDGSPGQSYLQGRGLTVDTMKRFKLGYDSYRDCVTIPYNPAGTYYGRRSVSPNARIKHDNLKDVEIPLFNAAALYASDVCFVVESPLCAISIEQEGGTAVAISGTPGKNRLIWQLKQKPTQAAIVLCLDNDDAGRKAQAEIGQALDSLGLCVVGDGTEAIMGAETNPDAPGYRKDPNEVLQHSGAEALREAVADTIDETRRARAALAQEAEAERAQRTGAGMVDSFLQDIQTEKYKPMPTGISDIDRALCGGFTRQQLVILGAAPGAGKTALAQWIFEGMAQRGTPCIYVNLEMSREQLLARSISRIAARRGSSIRALEVLQGYRWTDTQRAAILAAADEYKATIAPRFIMNPDGITADLDTIMLYMEQEAQRAEQAGQPAPVAVLDYLQLVTGQPREDAATVLKRAVASLKGYAIRHNTVVFAIIAHNRDSNKKGKVSMEAARDTSAIEYSADVQLALTYTACLNRAGQEQKTPEELQGEELQYVTLRIVKGRFGGRGKDVDLYFDGDTMTYTAIAEDDDYTGSPATDDEQGSSTQAAQKMRF